MRSRSNPRRSLLSLLAICTVTVAAPAQGSAADYKRAGELQTLVRGKVAKDRVRPNWLGQSSRFWYRNALRRGKEFVYVDAEKGVRRPAFDHSRLAAALSAATGKSFAGGRLPFDTIEFDDARTRVAFDADGKRWSCDLSTYDCKATGAARPRSNRNRQGRSGRRNRGRRRGRGNRRPRGPVFSPDNNFEAFAKDHNIYIRPKGGGQEVALTTDGTADRYYSPAIAWSPDSKYLATHRVIPAQEHLVHFIKSTPDDQVQPKHSTMQYLKPGDRVRIDKPTLFHVETLRQIKVDDSLFSNPYRTSRIAWRKDSSAFTFEYNARGHGVYRVLEVRAANGAVRAVIDEDPKTFFDYAHKKYRFDIDDGREIVWMSERSGWNHLYLFDGTTGRIKNPITAGNWVVRGVDRVDPEKRQIWFRASGRHHDQDPYFVHHYRINLDGTGLVALTEGNGDHTVEYSPDRKFLLDRYSRVDQPPITELRRVADGSLVLTLEEADASALLATGWQMPEPFVAKGRDGETDIWGVIYRPMNLDENKSYPIIEDIYAGPHSSHVPKTFSTSTRRAALCELGFIVVKIDGMGTSNRSKAFHDVCWKNLADAGFPDRILWMKAAHEKYRYMDIERVGIFGTSAGGQNAAGAVFLHPEFYKAAYSACGCHDNRMDKIWWNELWMGEVGPHYAASSNVTHAKKLQGHLMLMVGEMDNNVDPASTMQVVAELIKAEKDFEFFVMPNQRHTSGGAYGTRRRNDFFVRHLLGVTPPNRNKTAN